MVVRFFATFLIFLTCAAQAYTVVNSRADFQKFLDDFDKSNPEERLNNWTSFENKYSDVYSVVFNHANPNWYEHKQKVLVELFKKLPMIKDKMNEIFANADVIVKAQTDRFEKNIKNFDKNFKVYFVPSAFSFNAIVTQVPHDEKKAVVVGVDVVAEDSYNLDILFSHELFHKHHFENIDFKSTYTSIVSPIWVEGLATYFSETINPQANFDDIMMDSNLANACSNPAFVKRIAQEFLEVNPNISADDIAFRNKWFRVSGPILPYRQGYCLGYHVAKILHKTYNLEEMIGWGELTFVEKAMTTIKQLAK